MFNINVLCIKIIFFIYKISQMYIKYKYDAAPLRNF